MFEQMDANTFNNLFVERLDTPEGITKTAAAGSAFVRAVMREVAFSRRILPPESVTRADCQRSTQHDTLIKIVDIEPNSKAFAVNFRGEAEDNYIQGKRYALPFFKIESQKFQKQEAELLAYDFPITKVIEENSVKDLQAIEDTKFIEYAQSAVNITTKTITPVGANIVNRTHLTSLSKLINYDKLAVGCLLMNVADHDDWLVQPATDIGSPLASEMTVSGYKYDSIMKKKLVVTNKSSIVPAGTIWAFTEPAYLGNFFILNDTKFWIKKEADMIIWKTWEYIAQGFGNIRSIAKLTLPGVVAPIIP